MYFFVKSSAFSIDIHKKYIFMHIYAYIYLDKQVPQNACGGLSKIVFLKSFA